MHYHHLFGGRLLLLCCCLFNLLCCAIAQSNSGGLVITQLPYYQTFDDWPACNYIGACYENECSSKFVGGWTTQPYGLVPFSSQTWDWWVISGPTTSNRNITTGAAFPCNLVQTGPCVDHTTGTAQGKYLYAESSGCFGQRFSALTPPIVFTNASGQLSFWYFMFGIDFTNASTLSVEMSQLLSLGSYSSPKQIWTINGEQQKAGSDDWIQTVVKLDLFGATPQNPMTVIFNFKAVPAGIRVPTDEDTNSWRGDIAIDDVIATQESVLQVTPQPFNNATPSPAASKTGTPDTSSSPSSGQIAGIVGGVIGGLLLFALLLAVSVTILLLIISPRKPGAL